MGYNNILLKLLIALCFYIFLNANLQSPENLNNTFIVRYCIENRTGGEGFNKSNIEAGLQLISNRSCIHFLYNETCFMEKTHYNETCKLHCFRWGENNVRTRRSSVTTYGKCTKECSKLKNCIKYKKYRKCKKNKECNKCKKCEKCKTTNYKFRNMQQGKECIAATQDCSYTPLEVILPFIRFFYNKDKNKSDFNFNGSTSLWKKDVYNMEIEASCNTRPGCIAKKVLMYLGLIPTVRRIERDDYININNSNIKREYTNQYTILTNHSYPYVGYDYSSIAHFAESYGVISEGKKTFTRRQLNDERIHLTGQEYRPVFSDFKWLYYAVCRHKVHYPIVECSNEGFPRSDGSKACECPTGYSGKTCKDLEFNNILCSKKINITIPGRHRLYFKTTMNCTVELNAPEGKNIRITIEETNCTNNNPCFENDCLQIKFYVDISNTGLCVCGKIKNSSLTTLSNKALIQYKGKRIRDYAYLNYYII